MSATKRFDNRHVMITGGARGIGFEIAASFANEGAVLSLLDFNNETLSFAVEELKKITTVHGSQWQRRRKYRA